MKISIVLFLRLFILGCIIPIIVSNIVYTGFSTNYTVSVFSNEDSNINMKLVSINIAYLAILRYSKLTIL
jgi:hypothetical protein